MTHIDPDARIAAADMSAGNARILLVAVRAGLVEPVRAAMEADGAMQLRVCTEVRDAAGIAREWRPDAVLLDQALAPRMGQRLIERLRAAPATRDAAVLVLGDAAAGRTRAAVTRIGADGATPPPAEALPQALRAAIAARRAASSAASRG